MVFVIRTPTLQIFYYSYTICLILLISLLSLSISFFEFISHPNYSLLFINSISPFCLLFFSRFLFFLLTSIFFFFFQIFEFPCFPASALQSYTLLRKITQIFEFSCVNTETSYSIQQRSIDYNKDSWREEL